MSKAHQDIVSASPDPVRLGIQLRALTSGRKKPKAAVVPLWGNMEGYVKEDPEFGLQFVKRKMTSQIRSERVKERNEAFRVCAKKVLKGKTFNDRDAVRKAMSDCVREYFAGGGKKKE